MSLNIPSSLLVKAPPHSAKGNKISVSSGGKGKYEMVNCLMKICKIHQNNYLFMPKQNKFASL